MKSENKLVKGALGFLGWGSLTGPMRKKLEECDSVDEMLLLIPTLTRKRVKLLMDKLHIEESPEMVLYISMGLLGDTNFAYCAREFDGELANKFIQLEGLVHDE